MSDKKQYKEREIFFIKSVIFLSLKNLEKAKNFKRFFFLLKKLKTISNILSLHILSSH